MFVFVVEIQLQSGDSWKERPNKGLHHDGPEARCVKYVKKLQ